MTFADDAGEYTIVIRNKLGETSASASLLEEGKDSPELFLYSMGRKEGERLCVCRKTYCSFPVL